MNDFQIDIYTILPGQLRGQAFGFSIHDPKSRTKTAFTKATLSDIIMRSAGILCRGDVNPGYVKSSLQNAGIICLAKETNVVYPTQTKGPVRLNPQLAQETFEQFRYDPEATQDQTVDKYVEFQVEPGKGYVTGDLIMVMSAKGGFTAKVFSYNPANGYTKCKVTDENEIYGDFEGEYIYSVDHIEPNGKKINGYNLISRGFITAQFTEDGGVYLDVICGTKNGGKLLEHFIAYCKEDLHANYVKLNSLVPVLSFYPRYNFQHRTSCQTPAALTIPKELTAYMRTLDLESPLLYYDNREVIKFMMNLHKQGFTATEKETCLSNAISREGFKESECAEDGFRMRLCFDKPAAAAAPRLLTPRYIHEQQAKASKTRKAAKTAKKVSKKGPKKGPKKATTRKAGLKRPRSPSPSTSKTLKRPRRSGPATLPASAHLYSLRPRRTTAKKTGK